MQIMIVEHEANARMVLRRQLMEAGHYISELRNPVKVPDHFRKHGTPDVCLINFDSLGIDPVEQIEIIRQDYSENVVRLIVMLEVEQTSMVSELIDAGADLCMYKPFDKKELTQLLDSVHHPDSRERSETSFSEAYSAV